MTATGGSDHGRCWRASSRFASRRAWPAAGSTAQSVADWYPTLAKPSWTPPNAIFGPVWTALYITMGFAAWLVWKKDARFAGVRAALILFFIQLAFNISVVVPVLRPARAGTWR